MLFDQVYTEPGAYVADVTLPAPMRVSLHIRMENEHGQVFWDVTSLTFNLRFYQVLKWLVAVPFTLGAVLLVCLQPNVVGNAHPLPM